MVSLRANRRLQGTGLTNLYIALEPNPRLFYGPKSQVKRNIYFCAPTSTKPVRMLCGWQAIKSIPVLDRTNTYPHVNPKFPLELCDWMRCKRKGPYLSENMGFLSLIDDVEQDCLTFELLASIYKPNYFQKLAEVQKIFN